MTISYRQNGRAPGPLGGYPGHVGGRIPGPLYDQKTKPQPAKGGTSTQEAGEVPPPPKIGDGTNDELSQKVADAARSMVGKPVVGPNGENYSKHPEDAQCFYMVDKVLKDAGAKSASDFDKITGRTDQNYRWSAVQIELKDAKPGDVIQFRNYVIDIHHDKKTTKTGAQNSITKGGDDLPLKRPQHTAIVLANNGDGTLIVAEQHVLDRDSDPKNPRISTTIRKNKLYTENVPARTTTDTREEGNVTTKEETTETITVTGKVWSYRPQAKDWKE